MSEDITPETIQLSFPDGRTVEISPEITNADQLALQEYLDAWGLSPTPNQAAEALLSGMRQSKCMALLFYCPLEKNGAITPNQMKWGISWQLGDPRENDFLKGILRCALWLLRHDERVN